MRVVITGAGGMLGTALARAFANEPVTLRTFTKPELDITDLNAVGAVLRAVVPDVVINCAAYTRVDDAETHPEEAYRTNAVGSGQLASCCRDIGARYVYPSTDYVFDGNTDVPYTPASRPAPLNDYGRSKLAGEAAAAAAGNYLVVRTSWLYGEAGSNFVRAMVARMRARQALRVVGDQRGAPTSTYDFARALIALLKYPAPAGVYHVTNTGSTTWHDFAHEIATILGIRASIQRCTTEQYGARAPRPRFSVLDCSSATRLIGALRDWRTALQEALLCGRF
jgi:dTDP-4-dehydrorhamnose reductase